MFSSECTGFQGTHTKEKTRNSIKKDWVNFPYTVPLDIQPKILTLLQNEAIIVPGIWKPNCKESARTAKSSSKCYHILQVKKSSSANGCISVERFIFSTKTGNPMAWMMWHSN